MMMSNPTLRPSAHGLAFIKPHVVVALPLLLYPAAAHLCMCCPKQPSQQVAQCAECVCQGCEAGECQVLRLVCQHEAGLLRQG